MLNFFKTCFSTLCWCSSHTPNKKRIWEICKAVLSHTPKKLRNIFLIVNMFSRIVFKIDEDEIELELHEVVKVAMNLLQEERGDKIRIREPKEWEKIFENIMRLGSLIPMTAQGKLDYLLLMPIHIRDMKTPREWLFVARYLKKNSPENSSMGWWVAVADRLILVTNTESHRFYVSDHGFLADIVNEIRNIALDLDWLNPEQTYGTVQTKIFFDSLTPEELKRYKDKFSESVAEESLERLQNFHRDKSADELLSIQEKLRSDPEFQEEQWRHSMQMMAYLVGALFKKFCELKVKYKDFDHKIRETYAHNGPNFADQLIKRVVLASIAQEVNQGKHEPLYRPIFSYGCKKGDGYGDAYHEFAKAIDKYFSRQDATSPSALARTMREIFTGKEITRDNLAFLPNLVGAWFIAEVARNENSLLTGLMLIDMLENEISLFYKDNQCLYSWQTVLIHPENNNPSVKKVPDLYGRQLPKESFGGSFPMACKDSVRCSAEALRNNVKLNAVRQKEGSIMLHWIYLHLQQESGHDFSLRIENVEKVPPNPKPCYDPMEIPLEDIYKKIDKLEGSIRVKKKINRNGNVEKELNQLSKLRKLIKKRFLIIFLITPLLNARLTTAANLYPTVREKTDIHLIFSNFFTLYRRNVRPHDFVISSGGGSLFSSCIEGARYVYQNNIPDSLNSVNELRKAVIRTLLHHKTWYFGQVLHSIYNIMCTALEHGRVMEGVSDPLQILLLSWLDTLEFYQTFDKIIIHDMDNIDENFINAGEEEKRMHKVKLQSIKDKHDKVFNDCFENFVRSRGYAAYCQNLLANDLCGGKLELEILAKLLKVRIEVYTCNAAEWQDKFLIRQEYGLVVHAVIDYTVNGEAEHTIHMLLNKNDYNFLQPTEFGRRHYYYNLNQSQSILPWLKREYSFWHRREKEILSARRHENPQRQMKYDRQFALIPYLENICK